MRIQEFYPVIVTEKLVESRDFYVRWFGFQAVFESSWFIYLVSQQNSSISMAFINPQHPSSPPDPAEFNGSGMFLTLQVEDVAAMYQQLLLAGLSISYPVRDEPWGQRRFGVQDPIGIWVDVVQQIDPAPGFWDPYL